MNRGKVIRNAVAADADGVTMLLQSAGLPVNGLREGFGANYAVITYDGEIVAAAGIELYRKDALLRSVVVKEDARGFGEGSRLVLDRLLWSLRQGINRVYLLTTTAVHYFSRFGFRVMTRDQVPETIKGSTEFRSACPQSATVMGLELSAELLASMHTFNKETQDGMNEIDVKAIVKERYGSAAARVMSGRSNSCCGDTKGTGCGADPITSNLYHGTQAGEIPEEALLASLGCGNPTALAKLNLGETVLDLGSGGGIDVLLSARRVGPTGKAYGLDMTDEMLALAEENKRRAGADNVEFLRGEIEHIPLPDNSVDVIISNCVINLSVDKDQVLREAFRVLKPGGRLAVSDVVTKGAMAPEVRKSVLMWVGCVAGALEDGEYRAKLEAAGFTQIDLEPTRVYRVTDARAILSDAGIDVDAIAPQVDGKFMSCFIRAVKPAAKACCAPTCCQKE